MRALTEDCNNDEENRSDHFDLLRPKCALSKLYLGGVWLLWTIRTNVVRRMQDDYGGVSTLMSGVEEGLQLRMRVDPVLIFILLFFVSHASVCLRTK